MAKCYKFAISKTSTCDIGPIYQAPDGLQNPRETKTFAIENGAGKWPIATVQIGNNFAPTLRDSSQHLGSVKNRGGAGVEGCKNHAKALPFNFPQTPVDQRAGDTRCR